MVADTWDPHVNLIEQNGPACQSQVWPAAPPIPDHHRGRNSSLELLNVSPEGSGSAMSRGGEGVQNSNRHNLSYEKVRECDSLTRVVFDPLE